MADLDLNAYQIVLNEVQSVLPGFTHDTQQVTWTATMRDGSILNASGVEVATDDAATSVMVIDDLTARNLDGSLQAGDVIDVSVARRGCVFNQGQVVYSDGAIDATGISALEAFNNKFATVVSA